MTQGLSYAGAPVPVWITGSGPPPLLFSDDLTVDWPSRTMELKRPVPVPRLRIQVPGGGNVWVAFLYAAFSNSWTACPRLDKSQTRVLHTEKRECGTHLLVSKYRPTSARPISRPLWKRLFGTGLIINYNFTWDGRHVVLNECGGGVFLVYVYDTETGATKFSARTPSANGWFSWSVLKQDILLAEDKVFQMPDLTTPVCALPDCDSAVLAPAADALFVCDWNGFMTVRYRRDQFQVPHALPGLRFPVQDTELIWGVSPAKEVLWACNDVLHVWSPRTQLTTSLADPRWDGLQWTDVGIQYPFEVRTADDKLFYVQ